MDVARFDFRQKQQLSNMAFRRQEPQHVGQVRKFHSQNSGFSPSGAAARTNDFATVVLFLFLTATFAFTAAAQVNENIPDAGEESARSAPVKPAEDPRGPRRHFRVKNPASLSEEEAELIYVELKEEMARRYRLSQQPGAASYQKWTRYNRVPYRSASHGHRLLNNYANETARAYGEFERAGSLPVGSIIAKDSITVTNDGLARPGALYLMEKMPDGFNYVSGNWRYTMIMPDGSLFGVTKGEGAQRVKFCITCHLAVERQDHLFFIPGKYRIN